ncbi:hypothetical protein GCM10027517_12190 [Phycicoccus ginsengisoli]
MGVVTALAVTLVPSEPARAEALPAAAKAQAKPVASRADLVSAQVTARAQGARVEVESLRDEVSTTWANPDGTLTTERHQAAIRYRDLARRDAADPLGKWRDVDLTMAENVDGTAGPKGHPLGLSLAGAAKGAAGSTKSSSGTDVAAVDQGLGKRKQDREVSLGWAGQLGKPVLAGTTATYKDVKPGVDLVVDSRRTGYETHLVINTPAALSTLLGSAKPGSFTWDIPVKTRGLTVRAEKDGSASFVDADGQVTSRIAAPIAWDAAVDPRSGNRVNESPVAMTVTQSGSGKATLKLTPDGSWLTSPERQFPITIDPTYASGTVTTTLDTYVSSAYPTATYSADTELRVGTYNGGGDKYRSFLNFPMAPFRGKDIVTASLSLYEFHSWSCTGRSFSVHSVSAVATTTNWSNQPAPNPTTAWGSLTAAKGFDSSCASGRVTVPITGLIDTWSGATADYTGSMRLSASETDNYAWKKFYSLESSQDPYVTYTYNRKPNSAPAPTLDPVATPTYLDPRDNVNWLFTLDSTPQFFAKATDPDGNGYTSTIEVHNATTGTNTYVTYCPTPRSTSPYTFTPSGSTATCSVGATLANNTTYYARAAVMDDRGLWAANWSPWTKFQTAYNPPPSATVSCPAAASGSWTDNPPATDVTCTVKATGIPNDWSTPGYLDLTVDGVAKARQRITPTNDPNVVAATVTIPRTTNGAHSIVATSVARTGRVGVPTTYTFGWGGASLTQPTIGTASSGTISVKADGPPKGSAASVAAKVQWRVAGSGNESTGWTDGPSLLPKDNGTSVSVDGSFALATAVREAGATADLNSRVPVLLDVQVCFTYAGVSTPQCTWSQTNRSVTRVPHAFGNGYPTSAAGPGQVALFTGEFNTSSTDVSVPGYTGELSLSRSHSSFDGDGTLAGWPSDPVTGVFGPGWTASLQGADAGAAGMQVIDNTRQDGTIVLVDEEENTLVYQAPTRTRAYKVTAIGATKSGYLPVTTDTVDAASALTITNTTAAPGATMTMSLTEPDGTVTTWAPTAYSTSANTVWKPVSVNEPGQVSSTTYGHDGTGRVIRIVAPVPPNAATPPQPAVTCPTQGSLVAGCRALDITYATATTATAATPGDYTGRVKQVTSTLWDPAAGAMATTTVAAYSYDSSGRLVKETDPRTGLGTDYTWDGTSTRLSSIKPTGLAAYRLAYDTTPATPRVATLTRDNPAGSGAAVTLARFAYGIPLSGAGLPDLTSAGARAWYQASDPTTGYAVFGADYTGPVSGTGVDWAAADLQYADKLGYAVNTATYGAGAWQVTATDYDTTGNVVRQLDAGAINTVLANQTAGTPLDVGQANALSTQTIYNQDITGSVDEDGSGPNPAVTKVVTPAGTLVTDVYGPVRNAALNTDINNDGAIDVAPSRPHVQTKYDESAPTGANGAGINPATLQPYRLPTTITNSVAGTTTGAADVETTSTTVNSYAKLAPGDATEGDPWAFGTPAKVTTGGITRTTRLDSEGRTTETRQPLATTGTDAGTTKSVYYTAGTNPVDGQCGNKPQWAGLACRTFPAAAPTAGAGGATTLPDSRTTAYNVWLQPLTVIETSGAATRTTETRYDPAGRTTATWTTTTGVTGSTDRPGTYTHYRVTDGLVDYTGNLNSAKTDADTTARTTSTFDQWGRTLTSTNDLGDVTTTSYVAPGTPGAGSPATVIDPKGTTTFTYDGTDAEGKSERRGLVTGQTVTRPGTGGTLTFAAAYDADGKLVTQKMPGQVTQRTTYDQAGEPTALSYSGQVQPVTMQLDANNDPVAGPDGNPVYVADGPAQADQPWLAWSVDNDAQGRVRTETTGPSAGFDANPGVDDPTDITPYDVGQALAYDRTYGYDPAGRLTSVADHTATGHDVDLTTSPCTVRSYAFDANGRRTSLTAATHSDGNCAGTTGVSTVTTDFNKYDTADRPTLGAGGVGQYVYDAMGRQTTVPSTDAPTPGAGNITVGYFDDDLPRTITQAGTTTTFTLDSAGRRQTATTTTGTATSTLVRHYTDSSDNPSWTDLNGTITRYTESIGGDLGATIATDGSTDLTLATLHGDIVTTVPIPATAASTAPALGIDGWSDYQEYGATRPGSTTATVAGPIGYGWLGAKQRSTTTDTAGLTLMGDRLYNPTTGRFTSADPEPGGNVTAYAYPVDPINQFDLDGHRWNWKRAAKIAGFVALGACIAFSAGACAVAGAVAFGASFMSNRSDYKSGQIDRGTFLRRTAVDAALALVPGGRSARLVGRHSVGDIGVGFRGTVRAARAAVSRTRNYAGAHRGPWSARAAARHSIAEFRGNWTVRPRASARRLGFGIGAAYAGDRWG